MGYNDDLLPLADQINIVFKLELSPVLITLVNQHGSTLLSGKNSKREFSNELKIALKKVLANLSKNYMNDLLDKYFSQEGLGLFISNILIDLSTDFIANIRTT